MLIILSFLYQVFLWRACWHIGVANTAALQLARVMKTEQSASCDSNLIPATASSSESDTEGLLLDSPPGGLIDMGEDGLPTGILRERAVELIVAVMGKKSPAELQRFISEGLRLCSEMGLTSVQTNDASSLAVYKKLCEGNCLPIRVFLTPNYEELTFNDQSAPYALTSSDLEPYRPACLPISTAKVSFCDDKQTAAVTVTVSASVDYSMTESRLIVERVKIYADGSLGAETAALKKQEDSQKNATDGTDRGHTHVESSVAHGEGTEEKNGDRLSKSKTSRSANYTGILSHTASELTHMVSRARGVGHRVEVHAIGDAAAEQVSPCILPFLYLPFPTVPFSKTNVQKPKRILIVLSLLSTVSLFR